MNQLEQLKQYTTVVADTGDFQSIEAFTPRDATTNPSLILKAVQKPAYQPLLAETLQKHKGKSTDEIVDHLLIAFGLKILALIPRRVSTETDARLSFNTEATIAKGRQLIALYEAAGISRERVLIKIASTWEGIQAAAQLEKEGIRCNLTLLFSFAQAVACGDAKVQLISPFVGRIYDWHKKSMSSGPSGATGWVEADHAGANDPGVKSVRQIYNHYKRHGIATEVMGASFRNIGQIRALAGCDLLTIAPDLLAQLGASNEPLTQALSAQAAQKLDLSEVHHTEASFRFALNEDAMATEKLAEGIRAFCVDAIKLEALMQ